MSELLAYRRLRHCKGAGRTTAMVLPTVGRQREYPGCALLSGMVHAPTLGLYRPAARCLIVDDDRGPRLKLLLYLLDFGVERDRMFAVVGPLAGHECFDDAAEGFG